MEQDEFGLFGSDSDDSGNEADLERYEGNDDEDDDDPEKEKKKISVLTSKLSPEELFRKYDADESGFIDEDEFIAMLPHIGIHVSIAKAIRIFKRCDTDGGGEIDIDEFKMALFACDPNTGNTLGFSPSSLLGPRDAFELFDEDGTGEIDELEFADVLEYLGMKVSDEKQEAMFRKYDKDKSGYIDYNEFRSMWIRLSNVRGELEARGVEIPKNARHSKLQKMLEEILDEEERNEYRALEEAKWWHAWQAERERRSKLGYRALWRARDELAGALDAAGQVYILGRGKHSQFDGEALSRDGFFGQDIVQTFWNERVNPTYERSKSRRRKKLHASAAADDDDNTGERQTTPPPVVQPNVVIKEKAAAVVEKKEKPNDRVRRRAQKTNYNPGKLNRLTFQRQPKVVPVVPESDTAAANSDKETAAEIENESDDEERDMNRLFYEDREYIRSLRFKSVQPRKSTVWLWGHRVVQGAFGQNVAFALSDSGQVFSFGGNTRAWTELDPDVGDENDGEITVTRLTPRSSLLKLCSGKTNANTTGSTSSVQQLPDDASDQAYMEMKKLCQYFGIWEAPPSYSTRHEFLQQVVLPRLDQEELRRAMDARGHTIARLTKAQLLEVAIQSFELEEELLTPEERETFRAAEKEFRNLYRDKKLTRVGPMRTDLNDSWSKLLQVFTERLALKLQAEKARRIEELERQEEQYFQSIAEQRVRNEGLFSLYTDRGKSFKIGLEGITSRGQQGQEKGSTSNNFRGESAVWRIAAGGHHAALLTHRGTIYTWGTDTLGQLGHGSVQDVLRPQRLESLKDVVMKDVDCSATFSCAVTLDGKLYSWGSLSTGQLGVGDVANDYFQYSAVPLRVKITSSRCIRQVSCGSAHAAAVSTQGDLYVWGCANGYRLGLGDAVRDTAQQPIYVKQLRQYRVWQVSCGNSHTALCTEVQADNAGNVFGGEVFVCGSTAALAKNYSSWTRVESLGNKHVQHVSCGYSHTALVTTAGELYTWGLNNGGCTGHDAQTRFIDNPRQVEPFYRAPRNLAKTKPARQSSIFNNQGAQCAVNGQRSGRLEECIHTQYDDRPWWEVDLGQSSVITRIRVWNRTDTPRDPSRPRDEFSSRLFPLYILIGEVPFSDLPGNPGLKNAQKVATASERFTQDRRMVEWVLPQAETIGQYVRIQVDSTNFLHLAEVEVFGVYSAFKYVGTVDTVSCGNDVTMVIMKPLAAPSVVEDHFIRAVHADSDNAKILRQYSTYIKHYEKYTTGESLALERCRLCRANYECEICHFFNNTPASELREGDIGERVGLERIVELVKEQEPPRLEWKDDGDDEDEDESPAKPAGLFRSATKKLFGK